MNSKEFKTLINITIYEECKTIEEREDERLYFVIPLVNKIADKIYKHWKVNNHETPD